MDPLGVSSPVVDCLSLKTWFDIGSANKAPLPPHPVPNHQSPPFINCKDINRKLCLWSGDITLLKVDAIVHSTNETLNDASELTQKIHHYAGPELKNEIINNIKCCKTGETVISLGYNLPCRYIIHAVSPVYNVKYQTAVDSSLHSCYRNALESCVEKRIRTLAFSVINNVNLNYPPDQGAHVALRTVRRFLDKYEHYVDRIIFVVNGVDSSIYEILMPLYFPRSEREENSSCYLLPIELGGHLGEPSSPERQIRIIDNPHQNYEDIDQSELAGQLETSINISEHSFTHMEEDVDKQRLLGGQPSYTTADPVTATITSDLQHKQKYERLLRRAKTEDLSEVSGIGCLYQCGVDKLGRPVIVFTGKWFKFMEINLEKALLYLIYLLDPLVRGDYVIIYFHTITTTENHPSFAWIRQVYDALEYKYKKNLKAFYIVHPTLWTKIMTWWFTTFMAPQIKHKVHSVPGVEYLYDIIDSDQLEIPAYITEHDMTINGIRYYKPVSS